MQSNAETYLFNQATSNIVAISQDGANLIDRLFETYANAYINPIATATSDCFRSDYPFGYIQSYYNWPNTLPNEFYSYALNANITLNASTYNIYNKTPADIPYLNSVQQKEINQTASLDMLFIPLKFLNNDFTQQYIGLIDTFQRNYPGSINYDRVNQYIMYDPIADYWYTNTVSQPNKIVLSSPYFDHVANQSIITISKTLNDVYTGIVIGAVGGDLTLETLANVIKSIVYLTFGRAMLFENTGLLIADSKKTHMEIVSYTDLYSDINISQNNWDDLTNSNIMVDVGNFFVQSVSLSTGNGQYVLLEFVAKADVYGSIHAISQNISDSYKHNMAIIFSVMVGLLIIVIILILCLVNDIIKPLQTLSRASQQFIDNIGSSNIRHNVDLNDNSNIKETQKIFNKFKLFVDNYEQHKEKKPDNVANAYYNAHAMPPPDYYSAINASNHQANSLNDVPTL